MKLCFSTLGCPDWHFEQIAANAVAFGYEGVELRTQTDNQHLNPEISADEARTISLIFKEAGIKVQTLLGYAKFSFKDAEKIATNQALLRKTMVLGKAMNADWVRFFIGAVPKDSTFEENLDRVVAAIQPIAKEAADMGLKLMTETHDDWAIGDRMAQFCTKLNVPNGLAVGYDIFNSFLAGEAWEKTYAAVKPHFTYIQCKDGFKDAKGKAVYSQWGAGDVPTETILKQLRADGFDGWVSMEWEKKWHPDLEELQKVMPIFANKFRKQWDAAAPKK